mgnify:CR=1 FL=1
MGYNRCMRKRFVRLVREYRMEWAVATVLLYVLAIPFTLWIFPDNNIWLAMLVLFSGFTASVTTLGDMLISADDKESEV